MRYRPLYASLRSPGFAVLAASLLLLLAWQGEVSAAKSAKSKVAVAKAAWSVKTGRLQVSGSNGSGLPADLFDVNGRWLASSAGANFSFDLDLETLPTLPCMVRVQAGDDEALAKVKGAPKDCAFAPTCRIVSPAQNAPLQMGEEARFQAVAALGDKRAQPLKYEWDFAGGSLGVDAGGGPVSAHKKADALQATVRFALDDTRHRVRFVATDAQGRRCEDAVTVVVGSPPQGLPAKVAEQAAPKWGAELTGVKGDYVVLPFDDWTMQGDTDADFMPNLYNSMSPTIHNLKAVVYKKDRLPTVVTPKEAQLAYSAASNPSDPAGIGSINSTSQNWPPETDIGVAAPMRKAAVQKSQLWEKYSGLPDSLKADSYKRHFWAAFGSNYPFSPRPESANPPPDMGYVVGIGKEDDLMGSPMPGINAPYAGNEPQAFRKFDNAEPYIFFDGPGGESGSSAEDGLHLATLLPLSDVDDAGRVNPYPLFRVQAKQDGKVLATTDAVMTAGRDFQCRGCHAKGKIAANPNAPHTQAAYLATPVGKLHVDRIKTPPLDKPQFFDAESDSLYDQERAAALNYSSLHDFYDGYALLSFMRYGGNASDEYSPTYATDKISVNGPIQCTGCHNTAMRAVGFYEGWWGADDFDVASPAYDPNYTVSMHRFHGELQWNEAKTDIVRKPSGIYERWDWKTKGRNVRTLFPIFDDQGKQLPMEENCLKCHTGQRERHYRDRMDTAGITCYDCHGDMLAVGEAFPKNYLANPSKLGSVDLNDYRVGWYDEPDCGSCHIGDANRGGNKTGGFYSAGVRERAFDDADLSATTRAVDRSDPNARRFAAAPLANYKAAFPTTLYLHDHGSGQDIEKKVDTQVDAPVFRFGRDRHGNVPCAACHGSAHAIWPNRDPGANDNVTALQLQGHDGNILECNVCHTADSFKNREDLDGGVNFSGDAKPGILGGPHDLHPIDDPYWWKQADGDTANADGTTYGGWHNDYAKTGGLKGEDQCAACHGADHKGTRLSKTPVDRIFDFTGFDLAKLKKAGFKSATVKVAAGTPIGCDTCHSLDLSFVGSPGR